MTRRIIAVWLLLSLMLLCVSPSLAEGMQTGSMYVFTPNGRALRFRTTRSTSADNVICEIPYGTKVYVLDWDGTWALIQYNGSDGYVVKKYLQIARPDPFEEVQAAAEQAKLDKAAAAVQKELEKQERAALQARQNKLDRSTVKAVEAYDATVQLGYDGGETNLYKKASLLSDILQVYPDGTRLTVLAQNRDWAKVYNGSLDLEGFVLLEDLIPDEVEEEMLDEDY